MNKIVDLSVIIPHFNDGEKLLNALNSIRAQSVQPSEVIIVDDCSSDLSILNEIEKNNHNYLFSLRVIYQKINKGPSTARNIGVRSSSFDYIAFLDADDVWHPQKIEIQYEFMLNRNLKHSFHYYNELPINIEHIENYSFNLLKKYSFIYKQHIATPTFMAKKESFIFFDENIKYYEDYLCWLSNIEDVGIYRINLTLSHGFKKQIGASGLSGNIKKMHKGLNYANKSLFRNKKISLAHYILAMIMEYIKYPTRYIRKYL